MAAIMLAVALLGPMTTTSTRPAQTLSFGQIEQLWTQNGGDPKWAPTMAAIALFESGGNTSALNNNPSTKDYSVGLWQINYYGNLLAPRTQAYGSPSALQADPNAQARAAVSLLGNGSGISNWKGDPAGNAALNNGGPLTASQAQSIAAGKSAASVGITTAASSSTVNGCDSSTYLINASPFHFLNQCQLKALKGGAMVLAGGTIMIIGVALVIGKGVPKPAAALAGLVIGRETATRLPRPSTGQRGTASSHIETESVPTDVNYAGGRPRRQETGPAPEDF